MGIAGPQLDIAGKQAVPADGDGGALDHRQMGLAQKFGVITNGDTATIVLNEEVRTAQVTPVADGDGVAAAMDGDTGSGQLGKVTDDDLIVAAFDPDIHLFQQSAGGNDLIARSGLFDPEEIAQIMDPAGQAHQRAVFHHQFLFVHIRLPFSRQPVLPGRKPGSAAFPGPQPHSAARYCCC